MALGFPRIVTKLVCAGLLVAAACVVSPAAFAADAKAAAPGANRPGSKPLQWYPTWAQASAEARKGDKIILCYNCGSDWDEWTQKLDKEVLDTDLFKDWAIKNVVLFKNDYLRYKSGGPQSKEQNEKFKIKYNLSKTPTFLFLDCDGLLIARVHSDRLNAAEPRRRRLEPRRVARRYDDPRPRALQRYPLVSQQRVHHHFQSLRSQYLLGRHRHRLGHVPPRRWQAPRFRHHRHPRLHQQ